jgi:Transposase DDE domain group 1
MNSVTRPPALVRGDCGYGNEDIIDVCEQRGLSYLLRLRKTANVKRLIERLFKREDWTRATESSQGWQAIEDELCLCGWSKARRVVVLRRRIKNDVAITAKNAANKRGQKDGSV